MEASSSLRQVSYFLSYMKFRHLCVHSLAAGIRSGAGTIDCKDLMTWRYLISILIILQIALLKLRKLDRTRKRILSGDANHHLSRVNSIAKNSAYQLQKSDIRVNTICPGLIETGMTGSTFEYARQRGSEGKIGQLNPLGRYGVPEGKHNKALRAKLCSSAAG